VNWLIWVQVPLLPIGVKKMQVIRTINNHKIKLEVCNAALIKALALDIILKEMEVNNEQRTISKTSKVCS